MIPEAPGPEREFFNDNLLVRIHVIVAMIRWTGLAPWEAPGPTPPETPASDVYRGTSLIRNKPPPRTTIGT